MAFCSNCGTKIEESAAFCTECGFAAGEIAPAVEETSAAVEVQVEETPRPIELVGQRSQAVAAVKPKKPMTKKQKIVISVVAAVGVLIFGGYKAGAILTDKERMIDKFETAIDQKDKKALVGLLSTNDKDLKITEKSVAGLIEYLDDNPRIEKTLVDSLRDQSEAYDEDKSGAADSEELVTLKKDGKKFLFYDNYQLLVAPVYVTLGTNYKDTVFYLNGQEIGKSTEPEFEESFGPFLPGQYKLEAKLKTDFVELVKEEKLDIVNTEDDTYMYVYLEGEDVEVTLGPDTSLMDIKTKLFINGEDTGVDIIKNPTFGPVLTDGSMKMNLEIAYPWGTVTTDEVEIDDSYMELNPVPFTDEQFTEIMQLIKQYNNEELAFLSSGDFDKVTTVTDEYMSSLEGELIAIGEDGYYFKGKYLGSQFNMDEIQVGYYDTWYVQIPTVKMLEGTTELDEESEKFEVGNIMYLVYDEGAKKWVVNDEEFTDFTSFGGVENVKEIKNEDAKEYEYGRETAESVKKENDEYLVDYVMDSYLYGLIDAIYYNDFGLVEPYLKEGSSLYKSQQALVKNLSDKGITEDLEDYEIVDFSSKGNTYTIKTHEVVTIYYEDGTSKTNEYDWTYTAEYDEEYDELLLTNIE